MSDNSLDALRMEAEDKAAAVDTAEADLMATSAPMGEFSTAALGRVANQLNRVLSLFGEQAPTVVVPTDDLEQLPEDFNRALSMVVMAAADADLSDILSQQDVAVSDDGGLKLLSGKLSMLADSRDFKRFLKEAAPEDEGLDEEPPMMSEAGVAEDDEGDTDALFMQRM
jgi:hypothetical protein